MSEVKRSGKVKWFDSTKGYGFIAPYDGNKDLFLHKTSIHSNGFQSLVEGEVVEYTVEYENGRRTKALDVMGPNGAFVQGNNGGGSGGRGGSSGGGGGAYGDDDSDYGGGGYGDGGGWNGGGGGGRVGHHGGARGGGGGGGGSCYKCGEFGHFARDCTNGGGSGGGGSASGGSYYQCGDFGHFS